MTDVRDAYWRAFEDYLRETGSTDVILVTHPGGHPQFRIVEIGGVREGDDFFRRMPHFAVAVTLRRSKHGPAGARTQLVLPKRQFYNKLSDRRSAIEKKIPDSRWVPPADPNGETSSVDVWTPHHVDDRARWPEDFAWFVENLRRFRRVLTPRVLATL